MQQRGDRERVVAHQQVDVGRLDAGHRERGRPGDRAAGRGEVGHLADHRVGRCTSPRRARTPAASARSRARSADVITNAPAPSVTRQQSSRCSGDDLHRRREHVVDRDRVAVARVRVHRGPPAGVDRDLRELLGRRAVTAPCAGSRRARTRPSACAARTAAPTRAIGFGPGAAAERRRRPPRAAVAARRRRVDADDDLAQAGGDRGGRVLDVELVARAADHRPVEEPRARCRGTRRGRSACRRTRCRRRRRS